MKPKTHLLTFVVEDYFQSSALSRVVSPQRWQRFESRIQANTRRVMDLLDQYETRATFFVLGWVADVMPELLREIVDRGHEVASKGYSRKAIEDQTPDEFRADVRRSREAIETAIGTKVLGFRLGCGSLASCDLWALDVLADEGFRYDSSAYPQFRSAAKHPWLRFPYVHRFGDRELLELPLSTFGSDEWLLRAAGGNYARQFPNLWIRQAFRYWHDHYRSPFNMYFHVWEFDADPPRINGASLLSRVRQYRNLAKTPDLLRYFLSTYRFGPIAEVMEFEHTVSRVARTDTAELTAKGVRAVPPRANGASQRAKRERLTIVIPCYNEQPVLHYLSRTLTELDKTLGPSYELNFLFIDDGSTDGTANELTRLFGSRPNHRVIKHLMNQGVAAATLTGIRAAETDIVCAMDADCSYDPNQLQTMIPMLTPSVDLVTASPYHPLGDVMNVPRWRLFLSRGASRLYRHLLKNKLHTYTSCFRVYRKSAVDRLSIKDGGFLGITEILWRLDQGGAVVAECPAVLEVRVLGTSKLKTLRGILAHLRLMSRIATYRTAPHDSSPFIPSPSTDPTQHEDEHAHTRDGSQPPHATV